MKVINISKTFNTGGAAIAAHNIHLSLLNHKNVVSHYISQSEYRLINKKGAVKSICSVIGWVHQKISNLPTLLVKNRESLSCNLLPTSWHKYINNSDYDVVIVHWVGSGGLSISDLLKIKKPIIWVLHDMWIFCGCEHVSNNDRYIHGYSKSNKQKNVLIDIDRYFWKKKKKAIDQIDNIHFIAPSKWMFERAKQSDILKKSKISIINIPIDVDFWKLNPSKRGIVKYNHHSSINIAFGSSSASNNKGLKMFINSLNLLKESCYFNNIVINYIGRLDNNVVKKTPFIYNNYGFISSNNSLKDVYQNSHICVFPSRIESFGQMAAESSIAGACVIAYSETGISEFIKDGKNGLLFNVYSDKCLADTIRYAIDKLDRLNVLEYNKSNMNELLSMGYIGNEYYKLLSKICN